MYCKLQSPSLTQKRHVSQPKCVLPISNYVASVRRTLATFVTDSTPSESFSDLTQALVTHQPDLDPSPTGTTCSSAHKCACKFQTFRGADTASVEVLLTPPSFEHLTMALLASLSRTTLSSIKPARRRALVHRALGSNAKQGRTSRTRNPRTMCSTYKEDLEREMSDVYASVQKMAEEYGSPVEVSDRLRSAIVERDAFASDDEAQQVVSHFQMEALPFRNRVAFGCHSCCQEATRRRGVCSSTKEG